MTPLDGLVAAPSSLSISVPAGWFYNGCWGLRLRRSGFNEISTLKKKTNKSKHATLCFSNVLS